MPPVKDHTVRDRRGEKQVAYQRGVSLSKRKSDGSTTSSFSLVPRPKRVWELWHPIVPKDPKVLADAEKMQKHCVLCGAISHYRVGSAGFCPGHKQEAYQAQAKLYVARGMEARILQGIQL